MKWPESLKPNIRWSDSTPSSTRSLARIDITDLGLAVDDRIRHHTYGDTTTGIAALYRGATFLANRVAGLHMDQLQGKTVTPDLPLLLAQPETGIPYRQTIMKIVYSLIIDGNAYLWVRDKHDGEVLSIYVLNPFEVTVQGDARNLYPEYRWTGISGRPMVHGREIFHIPFNLFPGEWKGVGPVEACRRVLEGINAEQELARNLMVNDGTPGGTLQVDKADLTNDEAKAILNLWFTSDGESTFRGGPKVMNKSTTYTPMTFKPLDLQFIEQRKFSVQEVARLLGIDPFFVGEQSGGSMTYSTTESLLRLALTQTIGPDYLEPIEQTFSAMLPQGRTARFDVDEILRADMEARYRAGVMGVRNGLITVNEWREGEGLSPVAGGNELTVAAPEGALMGVGNA